MRPRLYRAEFMRHYGICLTRLGRFEEASRHLHEALDLFVDAGGADHPRVRQTKEGLVEMYEQWGKSEDAASWRREIAAGGDTPQPGSDQ